MRFISKAAYERNCRWTSKGPYKAEWINTKTGVVDKVEDFDHNGGMRTLVSPAYEEDIALKDKGRNNVR